MLQTIQEFASDKLYLAPIGEVTTHWFEFRPVDTHQKINGTLQNTAGN